MILVLIKPIVIERGQDTLLELHRLALKLYLFLHKSIAYHKVIDAAGYFI